MILDCVLVGAGGALGAVSRYLLGLLPLKSESGFPLMTLFINLLGSFCIGFIVTMAGEQTHLRPRTLLFLKVGFCGGFTTFSTFSQETLGLLQTGKTAVAAAYIAASLLLCTAAVFAGQWVAQSLAK